MNILIVDDSKAMRMIVRRALRMAGCEHAVIEATNGFEALKMVEDTPSGPDPDGLAHAGDERTGIIAKASGTRKKHSIGICNFGLFLRGTGSGPKRRCSLCHHQALYSGKFPARTRANTRLIYPQPHSLSGDP